MPCLGTSIFLHYLRLCNKKELEKVELKVHFYFLLSEKCTRTCPWQRFLLKSLCGKWKSVYGMLVLWQSTVMLHLRGRERRTCRSGRGGILWCPDQQYSAEVLSKLLGTNYSVTSIVFLCIIIASQLALEHRFAVLPSRWVQIRYSVTGTLWSS